MSSSISTNVMLSPSGNNNVLYIYNLPPVERRTLCAILDEPNIWPELATTHMGYSKTDLHDIRKAVALGSSPSDELLNMWGDLNHTVTELFILLYRMQQYSAMDVIKKFVDSKYHKLITRDKPDLSAIFRRSNNPKSEKILNCQLPSSAVSNSKNESTTSTSNYTSTSDDSVDTSKAVNLRNANQYASTIPQIDYKELLQATNNWSDKCILGKGGFGVVFKGIWKHTAVAVKKLSYGGDDGDKVQIQQSLNELKYLNSCRHDNILPLYGYSINGAHPCLVYQLMTNGSLEERLNSKKPPLTWQERLNVACGTARGLQYLHTFREKPLIHSDIKPANILLDPCNQPKIGDFGLAREGPNALNSHMEVSKIFGTKPYLPGEFLMYKSLSTKVDTYSFGVVLLEMFTGLRAFDRARAHPYLSRHISNVCVSHDQVDDLIDKDLRVNCDVQEICKRIINLGRECIAERPEHRPEMVMVLQQLEYQLQKILFVMHLV